jgi:hypothetical protein
MGMEMKEVIEARTDQDMIVVEIGVEIEEAVAIAVAEMTEVVEVVPEMAHQEVQPQGEMMVLEEMMGLEEMNPE